MAFTTRVQWDKTKILAEEYAARSARLTVLISEGFTDGNVVQDNGVGVRVWSTLQAAQDWITYVNTFNPAPLIAEAVTTSP